MSSDFPGNFNYGYVGASTWWGKESFLLRSAGVAQIISNLSNGKLPQWNPPYFDNPGDSNQIMQGINYKY